MTLVVAPLEGIGSVDRVDLTPIVRSIDRLSMIVRLFDHSRQAATTSRQQQHVVDGRREEIRDADVFSLFVIRNLPRDL
jgi:hypothetical protein